MRRFHISLAVADLQASIRDYSHRLGVEPAAVVTGKYAMWRTDQVGSSRVDLQACKLEYSIVSPK